MQENESLEGFRSCGMKEKVCLVNHDSDWSASDSDEACVKSLDALLNGVASRKDKPIYCEMHCGATVSIIPRSHIGDSQLEPSSISLEMWNKAKMKALGSCKLLLENPKTSKKYRVRFVVIEEELTPLLSHKAAEKMNLITVNSDKFESVSGVTAGKHDILQDFPDVFSGDIGTLPGSVRLTLKA